MERRHSSKHACLKSFLLSFPRAKVFVTAHQSVENTSAKMFAALKRRNYVTPTNYLETVRGYKGLLAEKRTELGEKAAKLQGGLHKLDETSVQVAAMKKVRSVACVLGWVAGSGARVRASAYA